MAQLAVPGKEPGTLVIPALGRTIKMVEWREDDFYDSVQTIVNPTAGTTLEVFRDLTNKNLQHTNLRTQRRIPAGSEFIMARVGVVIAQAIGNLLPTDDDAIKAGWAATLSFKLNDRLITEGMLAKYQSGIGMTGSTTRTATGVVTTGVPSAAAAPSLMVGENIAKGDWQDDRARLAVQAWMGSEKHRENLLRPAFRFIGVGVAWDGRNYYITQVLGSSG